MKLALPDPGQEGMIGVGKGSIFSFVGSSTLSFSELLRDLAVGLTVDG